MAEDNDDKSSKTEDPTERKLQKLREEGNVPRSREVNNFFALLAMLLAVMLTLPGAMAETMNIFGAAIAEAGTLRLDQTNAVGNILVVMLSKASLALMPTLLIMFALALFGSLIQTGVLFSSKPVEPNLSRISLLKGLERMFSIRSVAEFVKSILKLVIIGAALYMVLYIHRDEFLLLPDKTLMDIAVVTQILVARMLMAALAIAFLFAILDFLFQRSQYIQEQRMTRHELKEEFKETEGDPFIKGRQKQIRQERARRRMMQEVPKADVVITNPTHFSVALKYDEAVSAAPRVVAKGVDHIALKIRELAREHDVPLYEDPPLARQLYHDVELEDEVPLHLYEAVAKVIAYVYGLKKRKVA